MTEFDTSLPSIRQIQKYIKDQQKNCYSIEHCRNNYGPNIMAGFPVSLFI